MPAKLLYKCPNTAPALHMVREHEVMHGDGTATAQMMCVARECMASSVGARRCLHCILLQYASLAPLCPETDPMQRGRDATKVISQVSKDCE